MDCFRDFVGNELKVGDNVAFIHRHYRELRKGKILKLSQSQATILDISEQGTDAERNNRMGYGKTCRSYEGIVKI